MSIEAIILAAIPGTLALIAVLVQARKDRNKPQLDSSSAYSTLLDALQKSGKTIEDLMEMLAEVPHLRQELAQVKADWKMDNLGAWANHDKLIEHQIAPPYRPSKRYATGPLKEGTGQT